MLEKLAVILAIHICKHAQRTGIHRNGKIRRVRKDADIKNALNVQNVVNSDVGTTSIGFVRALKLSLRNASMGAIAADAEYALPVHSTYAAAITKHY